MNSETLRDIKLSENSFAAKQRERQAKLESEVIEKGNAALSFTQHPYWLIFENDLIKLKGDITEKILSGDLQKLQIDKFINIVQMIDVFIKNPRGYIDKMKLLVNRKTRG
jgi:hypothetical protein